jgi:hypothetical protein
MEAHLGGGFEIFHRIMSKVSERIQAMQNDTLMVAGSDKLLKLILSCFFPFYPIVFKLGLSSSFLCSFVLDPYTHYQINMSNILDYAVALTDAIEKMADPDSDALAIKEIITYRECCGQFGQRVAHLLAEQMSPSKLLYL